jgi:hypothetical protein
MQHTRFEEPVTVLVGMGFPNCLKKLKAALWPLSVESMRK